MKSTRRLIVDHPLSMSSSSSASKDKWPRDEQLVRWSVGDEARIRDKIDLWSKLQCKDEMKALAACMSDKTISVAWSCGEQRTVYTQCLKSYTSDKYLDMHKRESISKRLSQMKQAKELRKTI
mmetsp:Transcript_10451/g.16757  ORF Transcript_10451/g.16757 Transcript_10451/m.16757 type:complete len:123 (+) Transcript_10451:1168-1536(+)|eukprot:jgi/Bigna1/141034/aug1.60_g15742